MFVKDNDVTLIPVGVEQENFPSPNNLSSFLKNLLLPVLGFAHILKIKCWRDIKSLLLI